MYCDNFVTLFSKEQLKGCQLIKDKLTNDTIEKTSVEELEDICDEYKIHFKFSIKISANRYSKLLPTVCDLNHYKPQIWDLLIDQGDYSPSELHELAQKTIFSSKFNQR